jgi:hypothetical protein
MALYSFAVIGIMSSTVPLLFFVFLSVLSSAYAVADEAKLSTANNFAFALIGDAPYGQAMETSFAYLVDAVNDDSDIQFVIHAGDIKSGGERCSDDLLTRRFKLFQKFEHPFIFTPGDNEWTDCHRDSNGNYLPTERLDFLRRLFYPNPHYTTGSYRFAVATQADTPEFAEFVENTLFIKNAVLFTQIHIVGSNNNLNPWHDIDPDDTFKNPRIDRKQEFLHRNNAAVAWLRHSFNLAMKNQLKAVFITFHANPKFGVNRQSDGRIGFNAFIDSLFQLSKQFNKPVMLAHGDHHKFFTDYPEAVEYDDENQQASYKLRRLQTFGHTDEFWLKIKVSPDTADVFEVLPMTVDEEDE